ncbi:hypothetical protein PACTADRAFT_48899 [Pachysolen tannophilus NRRL Y-2460]|uniref:Uncharacterized protein n=1 Tax=Pachysolen tannophilus NRRL Y-2460 TaxID=669874 RepID=A0A1E4TZI1_PACTA|nr:hypothetical protein PACTADRAFT_48899 [Pachysolen tannophilus NRRL Y-2460]
MVNSSGGNKNQGYNSQYLKNWTQNANKEVYLTDQSLLEQSYSLNEEEEAALQSEEDGKSGLKLNTKSTTTSTSKNNNNKNNNNNNSSNSNNGTSSGTSSGTGTGAGLPEEDSWIDLTARDRISYGDYSRVASYFNYLDTDDNAGLLTGDDESNDSAGLGEIAALAVDKKGKKKKKNLQNWLFKDSDDEYQNEYHDDNHYDDGRKKSSEINIDNSLTTILLTSSSKKTNTNNITNTTNNTNTTKQYKTNLRRLSNSTIASSTVVNNTSMKNNKFSGSKHILNDICDSDYTVTDDGFRSNSLSLSPYRMSKKLNNINDRNGSKGVLKRKNLDKHKNKNKNNDNESSVQKLNNVLFQITCLSIIIASISFSLGFLFGSRNARNAKPSIIRFK